MSNKNASLTAYTDRHAINPIWGAWKYSWNRWLLCWVLETDLEETEEAGSSLRAKAPQQESVTCIWGLCGVLMRGELRVHGDNNSNNSYSVYRPQEILGCQSLAMLCSLPVTKALLLPILHLTFKCHRSREAVHDFLSWIWFLLPFKLQSYFGLSPLWYLTILQQKHSIWLQAPWEWKLDLTNIFTISTEPRKTSWLLWVDLRSCPICN